MQMGHLQIFSSREVKIHSSLRIITWGLISYGTTLSNAHVVVWIVANFVLNCYGS